MKSINIERVVEIIDSKIKDFDVSIEHVNEELTDLGMDSITFISIIVALEEEFECEFPDEKLLLSEMNTIQKIINVLHSLE